MDIWFQQFLYFAQVASFQLPLAIAFALTQGITRRVFLSYGDLAMFASFGAIYTSLGGMVFGFDDWQTAAMALAMSIACGAALGVAVARIAMGQRLLAHPLAFMVASVGVSIVVQEVMRIRTGAQNVWAPPLFDGLTAISGATQVSVLMTWSITIGFAGAILTWLVLRFTRFGLNWQACSQSQLMASLCGVNAMLVASQTYALAGGLAGLTGWTSSIAYGGASFASGIIIGFKAMFASVIGGFGTLRGAVIGTLVFAAIEVLWSHWFGTAYRDVAVFSIVVACLVLKPEGLSTIKVERD